MNDQDLLQHDTAQTLANRDKLFRNKNLLYWYENLYKTQFSGIEGLSGKFILEIGSGTSPLKFFYKHAITSDILDLDYLDHKFDCQEIGRYAAIPDGTVDIITMTNVLHHLQDPVSCLKKMFPKLREGGSIIMTEPYYSNMSNIIYKYLHFEPSVFDIDRPVLKEVKGPLSSANVAIPYMIFFSNKGWDRELADLYDFSKANAIHYSALSYMITGGISRRIPIPHSLYRSLFGLDAYLAKRFPSVLSSFFIIKLVKKRTAPKSICTN